MPLSHSPEARLLFRGADPSAGSDEMIRLAMAVDDWERCVTLADGELATTALWRGLREWPALPAPIAAHLRRTAMFGDFRMQQLADRVRETTAAFAAAGVPVLLLKGAALGALTDPTFQSRPMTDVDLLVRSDDVPRARAALRAAAWSETDDPTLRELLAEGHHHLPPFLDARLPGLRLELHTAVLPPGHPFAWDESHLLRDATPAMAPFAGALVPSLEHLLLHAAIHFAWQHAMTFGAWRTFRLAGAVITAPDFSWDRFVATARAARGTTACYWTLRLASRMCGISVPEAVLARLAPPTPEFVRAAIERHFIAALVPGEAPASPSVGVSRLLWRVALRPRWSGHRVLDRTESDQRWELALRATAPRSLGARLRAHAAGARDWWQFVSLTLFDL